MTCICGTLLTFRFGLSSVTWNFLLPACRSNSSTVSVRSANRLSPGRSSSARRLSSHTFIWYGYSFNYTPRTAKEMLLLVLLTPVKCRVELYEGLTFLWMVLVHCWLQLWKGAGARLLSYCRIVIIEYVDKRPFCRHVRQILREMSSYVWRELFKRNGRSRLFLRVE